MRPRPASFIPIAPPRSLGLPLEASRRRLVVDDFEVDVRRHATSYRDEVTGIGLGVVFYFLPVWLASVGVAMWLVPRIGVHSGCIAERAPGARGAA